MPVYEYRCNQCRRRISVLTRSYTTPPDLRCEHCGSSELTRIISSFAFIRSEESRLEALSDPSSIADLDENDPRSLARWARRMKGEIGEDLGSEFDEMVDRMEAGDMPEDLAEGGGMDDGGAGDDLGGLDL